MIEISIENYRLLIRQILAEHAAIPYAHGDILSATVFDRDSDRYLLVISGRENGKRVHGCLIHVEIINGKIWIQCDGPEYGVAAKLLEAGVPKERIVLGFRSPEIRRHTEFAVA